MTKVVKVYLISEQVDKDGNKIDYKKISSLLWDLQRQTRDIKNKTVQLCWEWLGYSSDYYKKNEEYPKEKDTLGYTLSGFVYDHFKTGYDLYSANLSSSSRDVCNAFSNAKKEMLKGERSILSYKANQPLDIYNKAISLYHKSDIALTICCNYVHSLFFPFFFLFPKSIFPYMPSLQSKA